jgi:hypothetical protein
VPFFAQAHYESLLEFMKKIDINQVVRLLDVQGEEDALERGWDAINAVE